MAMVSWWKGEGHLMIKDIVKRVPILGKMAVRLRRRLGTPRAFTRSVDYWTERYRTGGDSGVGSYGHFAVFKAEVLNAFVDENKITSVIEFGCGDGNQLRLTTYPRYLGFDVSPDAIARCRRTFARDSTKSFHVLGECAGRTADLVLSLDVIYHLVEDDIFADYMHRLFAASDRWVIIYSSNIDALVAEVKHVRHRQFTKWIEMNAPSWRLMRHVPNRYPYRGDHREGSWAEFFIYESANSR
jgi:SAM-dependent methyltransferase